jgi:hypothetical protein
MTPTPEPRRSPRDPPKPQPAGTAVESLLFGARLLCTGSPQNRSTAAGVSTDAGAEREEPLGVKTF